MKPSRLVFAVVSQRDARAAATLARRQAYAEGWVGLRVCSTEELGQKTRRGWLVTLEAAEYRLGVRSCVALEQFRHEHWTDGTRVRTKKPGIDYSGGRRHVMTARSQGVVVGRRGANLRVAFPILPGHSFLYVPDDLEELTMAGVIA